MSICYMYCGADNVGKSTLVQRQMSNNLFTGRGKKYVHFSVPPNLSKPFEQYYDFLTDYRPGKEVLICDRGYIDTYFYSQYRDNTPITRYQFEAIHKFWKDSFKVYMPLIVRRPWKAIEEHHKQELKKEISAINEGTTLATRKLEYEAFYNFMDELVQNYPDIFYLDLVY